MRGRNFLVMKLYHVFDRRSKLTPPITNEGRLVKKYAPVMPISQNRDRFGAYNRTKYDTFLLMTEREIS